MSPARGAVSRCRCVNEIDLTLYHCTLDTSSTIFGAAPKRLLVFRDRARGRRDGSPSTPPRDKTRPARITAREVYTTSTREAMSGLALPKRAAATSTSIRAPPRRRRRRRRCCPSTSRSRPRTNPSTCVAPLVRLHRARVVVVVVVVDRAVFARLSRGLVRAAPR